MQTNIFVFHGTYFFYHFFQVKGSKPQNINDLKSGTVIFRPRGLPCAPAYRHYALVGSTDLETEKILIYHMQKKFGECWPKVIDTTITFEEVKTSYMIEDEDSVDDVTEILHRAEYACKNQRTVDDTDIKYNIFSYNCEHFVRYCRTGEAVSYQTDPFTCFSRCSLM